MPSIALPVSLRGQLLSGSKFSPYSLFTFGTQGIWLDPSDVANLTWRRNLATQTEALHTYTSLNSPTVTANAATAPDGTMTATQFEVGAGQTAFLVRSVGPNQVAGNNANSIYFKLVGATIGVLGVLRASRDPNYCGVNVSTLAPLTNNAAGVSNSTVAIDTLPNGWYRLRSGYTNDTSEEGRIQFSASTAGTKILLWGVQVEQGSVTATDYQRITDVNTEVIERFPTATMYQDAAGTTAVTTPGQPVGLRLDKSKGLALGAEKVVNGTFDTNLTGWTDNSGGTGTAAVVGGRAVLTRGASGADGGIIRQSFTTVVGNSYRLNLSVFVSPGKIGIGTSALDDGILNQTIAAGAAPSFLFRATTTTTHLYLIPVLNNTAPEFDNISVKELPGNHATQSVLGSRPMYGIEPVSGRRNLLTWSEDLTNAVWAKSSSNVVANSTNDPTGAATGDTARLGAGTSLIVAALDLFTNSIPYVSQPTAVALTAGTYTYSVYVKGGVGLSHVQLRVGTTYQLNPSNAAVIVRLSDGALTSGSGGEAVSNAGGGWWRVSIPFTATAAIYHVGIWFWNSSSIASAVGTEGLFLWGAQLELGSTATPYQKVTTAFDVTEAGVQTCHYVQYDGSDDGMITNSIDFTATDKMSVFAGVRRLSNATAAIVAELSTNSDNISGSFSVWAPSSNGGTQWYMQSRGNVITNASASGYAVPVSNVFSGLTDISGDSLKIRVNGAQVAESTADQGTVNFGNHIMSFGRRSSGLVPFYGRDYGIVVVGKATTADEITATEKYMAGKTGVTLP